MKSLKWWSWCAYAGSKRGSVMILWCEIWSRVCVWIRPLLASSQGWWTWQVFVGLANFIDCISPCFFLFFLWRTFTYPEDLNAALLSDTKLAPISRDYTPRPPSRRSSNLENHSTHEEHQPFSGIIAAAFAFPLLGLPQTSFYIFFYIACRSQQQ